MLIATIGYCVFYNVFFMYYFLICTMINHGPISTKMFKFNIIYKVVHYNLVKKKSICKINDLNNIRRL